jgi:GntR family transcriptional regulator
MAQIFMIIGDICLFAPFALKIWTLRKLWKFIQSLLTLSQIGIQLVQIYNDTFRGNPMKIVINLRSDVPIYIQIVEQMRQQVANGELKSGDQLPTVRALAADLRVNFNTVARAYRMLDEAHIISTQQGRGTYILDESPPEATENLRVLSLEALIRRFIEEASQLGFTTNQIIEQLTQHITDQKSSH